MEAIPQQLYPHVEEQPKDQSHVNQVADRHIYIYASHTWRHCLEHSLPKND